MFITHRFSSFKLHIFFIITLCLLLAGPLSAELQDFAISGQVTSTGGRGLDGIWITFNDGETTQYEVTSGGGFYSHVVYSGWSGTVTPSDPCYTFTPASVSVGPVTSDITQDFSGSLHTLTISGVISDGPPIYAGDTLLNPLSGVLVTLSTGGATVSAGNGSYDLTVPCGWYGTITPIKVGWEFTPSSRYYPEPISDDQTEEDFTGNATSTKYTISGQVTDAGGRAGMDGVAVEFFDGVSIHTETTAGGGYYSYTVPAFWTGTVTPTLAGYSFVPVYAALGPVQADITQNFTATYNTYTIAGTVMDLLANPIPGVTLTLSTGDVTTTNSSGYYSFTVVHGWSGNLVPSRRGWTFKPTYRSFNGIASDRIYENFVGKEAKDQFTVSGTVTVGQAPLAGVVMKGLPGSPTTSSSGFYSGNVAQGWSGTVTPTKPGYFFKPSSRTYDDVQDNYVNENYEALTNEPPHVEIVSPPDQSFVNGDVVIKVEASDNDGINKVEIYINGQKVAEYLNIQNKTAEIDPRDLAGALQYNRPAFQFDNQGNAYSIVPGKDEKMMVTRQKDAAAPEILLEEAMIVSGWRVKPDGSVIIAGITPDTGESWIKWLDSGIAAPPGNPRIDVTWSLDIDRQKDMEIDITDLLMNPAKTAFTCKYLWDTSLYAQGTHQIKAVAFDTPGLSAEDQIELNISSLQIQLQLSREQDKAWIIVKDYVKIEATVNNPDSIPISKFIIYRKAKGEEFLAIAEIPAAQGNSITYDDQDIDKNKQYTYKVVALDENGLMVGASEEKTI